MSNLINIINTLNLSVIILSFIVSVVYFMRFFVGRNKIRPYARKITFGIGLTSSVIGVQHLYLTHLGLFHGENGLFVNNPVLNILYLLGLVLGYGLHLSPFIQTKIVKDWFVSYAVFFILLYLSVFQIQKLIF